MTVALPYVIQELVTFLIPFAILAILALGLNLQWGHTGLFNAGAAGFYAIGAYTAAFLVTAPAPPTAFYSGHLGGFSQNFAVGVATAFVLAAAAGSFIGILTLKLREDYLAIATLALAEVVRVFLRNAESLTGGVIGVLDIPRPFDALGLRGPESDAALALLLVGFVVLMILVLDRITDAPWGRTLRAVREDEQAAQVLGKDTFFVKLQAFAIGCGIMGAAGAFLAIYSRSINSDFFVPFTTFSAFVVVILGGSGNNKGVVLGAAIFFFFDWLSVRVKDYLPPEVADRIADYRLMAIGIVLILLVMFRPQGLLPERRFVPRRE